MGAVDVRVEQTALADFELGDAVEVDSCALAIALEQLSARDEGERPPLGRTEPEATVGADERDELRALISGTPHREVESCLGEQHPVARGGDPVQTRLGRAGSGGVHAAELAEREHLREEHE